MMTGTSGRASRARGSNSIPLIPGMLTSERMRMSLAASAEPTRSKASFADCANSMAKRDARSSLRNCWRKSSATSGSSSTTRISALMIRSGAWKDDGELRKGARLGRDLEHPAVLLDDDVVADRETEPGAFAGGLGGEERIEHFRLHLVRNAGPVAGAGRTGGNPDIRPGLRSGAQQAIHWVRLPRPTALEERRQPGNRLSRSSSRRGGTATRIAARCQDGGRYASSSRATGSGRPRFRLGMVQRAATPER